MNSGLTSLILDLDGTLLDSKEGILESFGAAFKSVFPGAVLDMAKVPVGPPIRKICKAALPDISDSNLELMAKAYRAHYDSQGCRQTRLYEGARELLSLCAERDITLEVATNKPLGVTTDLLAHFKISDFFSSIASVDSIHPPFASKTEIIQYLLKSPRADLAQTAYVGDTAEDAAAAKACDISFIWAAYGYGRPEPGAAILHTINRLAELAEWL